MTELLRTAGQVKEALMLAVNGVTIPARIPTAALETLSDRCARCRSLPDVDPATGRLVAAAELLLTHIEQMRSTGAVRVLGTKVEAPEFIVEPLREALLVWIRETHPGPGTPARQRADRDREAEADEYFARRADAGDWNV